MASQNELRPLQTWDDGTTARTPKINVLFSHAAETVGNSITTTVTVYDGSEQVTTYHLLRVWYAASANGAPDATGNTVTAAGTGTVIETVTSNAQYIVQTNSSGVVTMANVVAGGATRYLCVALPNGEVVSSDVITWAA